MSDSLSLLAQLHITEILYLDFQPEHFQDALHQFEQISLDLSRKAKMDAREKQIAALAHAAQAVIWAHWLFGDPNNAKKMQHVTENCGRALELAGDARDVTAAVCLALGIMHQNRGEYRQALEECAKAVEADRDYPAALIRKATALLILAGLHKYSPANTPCAAAISAFGHADGKEVERQLEEVRRMAGEAETLLRETLQSGLPGEAYARRQLLDMLVNLGRLYAKTGHLVDRGLPAYDQATALDDRHFTAWNNIAYRIDQSGSGDLALLEKAKTAAERALELARGTEKEKEARALLEKIERKIEQARNRSSR
jgi:tetratricopeptide (TPR) repeat protein